MSIAVMVALPAVLLGALLVVLGRRGVRIDDHPLCRKCGFDLTGKPETSTRCSECGADLTLPRAVRIGHRRRRPWLLGLGAFMLLISGGAVALMLTVTDWQSIKPAWWLVQEIDSQDVSTRDGAFKQLDGRIAARKLSKRGALQLADRVLALQANPKSPWIEQWGDLFEAARMANLISDDQWRKYALAAVQVQLEVRPQVRQGDVIPFWLRDLPSRCGTKGHLYRWFTAKPFSLGQLTVPTGFESGTRLHPRIGGGATGSTFQPRPSDLQHLHPASYTAKLPVLIEIHERSHEGPLIVETTRELTAPLQIVPATAETVALLSNPGVRAAIETSITFEDVRWENGRLSAQVRVRDCPVAIGFEVIAMVDGIRTRVGELACPAAKPGVATSAGRHLSGNVPSTKQQKVDFLLKSDRKVAQKTTDIFEIWEGEIVIKGVPVKYPATSPTTR